MRRFLPAVSSPKSQSQQRKDSITLGTPVNDNARHILGGHYRFIDSTGGDDTSLTKNSSRMQQHP
jgi:hypothetical protein